MGADVSDRALETSLVEWKPFAAPVVRQEYVPWKLP